MDGTKEMKQQLLRAIPNVDDVVKWVSVADGSERQEPLTPKRVVLQAVREILTEVRQALLSEGESAADLVHREAITARVRTRIEQKLRPNLQSVINGTGVVVHTNLGRSILPPVTMEALHNAGSGYSNLEMDLATGKRGSRYSLVEELLCELTGAESALVVNNNAAAVLLVLGTLAQDKEVIVSRGQLVEIGGSFRIPDVMARSGAHLVEVGATNRTHLWDYENALTEETALLLKVHASNYKIIGFSSEVPAADLVALGRRRGVPVMEDLGSGCLVDLSQFGLQKEPTVMEVVRSGIDVVTFSGDKLLGGPQAGIIVGTKSIIDRIKKNPLNRALRIDKFTLAGLESILRLYYDEKQAIATIPTLVMLAASEEHIKRRAQRFLRRVRNRLADACMVRVVATDSRVGGGALPEQSLPSWAVSLQARDYNAAELERHLRGASTPVLCRIENDLCLFDMRTVQDQEVAVLAQVVVDLLAEPETDSQSASVS